MGEMPTELKRCTKCGEEKPATLEFFHKKGNRLRAVCKECRSQRIKPIKIPRDGYKFCSKCGKELLATTDYFFRDNSHKDGLCTQCKDCRMPSSHKWQKENPEKAKKYWLEYRENNSEKYKQRRHRYWINNREKITAKNLKYSQEHPEKIKEIKRKYKQLHPEKVVEHAAKRRSRVNNLPARFTANQWKECKSQFSNGCAYCGKHAKLTQDHFVPVSNGGEYTVDNIIPACMKCNVSKNNNDFFDWYPKQVFYSKSREKKILKYLGYRDKIQQLSFM